MSVPPESSTKSLLEGMTAKRRRLLESMLKGDRADGESTASSGPANAQGAGARGGKRTEKAIIDETNIVVENISRLLGEGKDLKAILKNLDVALKDLVS